MCIILSFISNRMIFKKKTLTVEAKYLILLDYSSNCLNPKTL